MAQDNKNKNKKDNKVVDLVLGSDGVYQEKDTHLPSALIKKKVERSKEVDQFFEGVDKGLDFFDEVFSRVDDFMKRFK